MLSLITVTIFLAYPKENHWRIRLLEKRKGKLNIINLGTSHGSDFSYDKSGLTGMHFNFPGNTLFYDLHNYLFIKENNYLVDNGVVVIPVSYFAFGLDENRTDGNVGEAFANKFYDYLPSEHIYNYSVKKDVKLSIYKLQEAFDKVIQTKKEQKHVKKQKHIKNAPTQKPDRESIIKKLNQHAKRRAKRHKMLSNFSSEAQNMAYLERLLKEIKDANHQPVLVTTPYYNAYNKNFGKDWLNENYFSKMHDLATKYDVLYLDYSHDDRFTNKPGLYNNSDHLNEKGKQLFSTIFLDDISLLLEKSKPE